MGSYVQATCLSCGTIHMDARLVSLTMTTCTFSCPKCGSERTQTIRPAMVEKLHLHGAYYGWPQFTPDDIIDLMDELDRGVYGKIH